MWSGCILLTMGQVPWFDVLWCLVVFCFHRVCLICQKTLWHMFPVPSHPRTSAFPAARCMAGITCMCEVVIKLRGTSISSISFNDTPSPVPQHSCSGSFRRRMWPGCTSLKPHGGPAPAGVSGPGTMHKTRHYPPANTHRSLLRKRHRASAAAPRPGAPVGLSAWGGRG